MWRTRLQHIGWQAAAASVARNTASSAAVTRASTVQLAATMQVRRSVHSSACARCAAAASHSPASAPPPPASASSSNSYLRPQATADSAAPQMQRQSSLDPRSESRLRDRPAAESNNAIAPAGAASAELTPAQQAAREMDRATKAARAARMRARKSGSDWKARMESRRERTARIPLPQAPPIYFPTPFAALPVIPSPQETLESSLIRIDKVPKSPGFSKEISRIRGQLAKYNFTARRQLEVAEKELATKLKERIDAFPRLRKQPKVKENSDNGSSEQEQQQTATHDPFAPQLHPYDHSLITHSLSPLAGRGGAVYTSLLNHCGNLVQKLRGAAAQGLKGLNHSKNMQDSRKAHMEAIARMKSLWEKGDALGNQKIDGGSGQKSGMVLVESLRLLSRQLRHIPTIEFDRNLLDVKRNVASYLSVLPQEFFFPPAEELTFERLRPYLPPSPTYTFSLVGAPNVGKSSLLRELSRAKVEVKNFAFTTTAIQVGHLEREEKETPSMQRKEALTTGGTSAAQAARRAAAEAAGMVGVYPTPNYTPAIPLTRVQLVDTPGLLFRPDILRKNVEHLTLNLCAHIQPLLLAFVIDESGTSGNGAHIQRFLLREMRTRFGFYNPPHPLASDTDPRNHIAHDALYSNVAADAELQSLTRRLQIIPWLLLRSKSDVKKKDKIKDEILAEGAGTGTSSSRKGAEYEIRRIEEELKEHNRTILNQNQEAEAAEEEGMEEEAEETRTQEKEDSEPALTNGEQSSSDQSLVNPSAAGTALQLSRPAAAAAAVRLPHPQLDRANWKMELIRLHMQKYLRKEDGSFDLGEDDAEDDTAANAAERGRERKNTRTRLQIDASTAASDSSSSSSSSTGFSSSSPASIPLPTLSVSCCTAAGLAELRAHIWFEVDQRESLRLEKAYKEMKKRIQWITSQQGSRENNERRIEQGSRSGQQQQQLPFQ